MTARHARDRNSTPRRAPSSCRTPRQPHSNLSPPAPSPGPRTTLTLHARTHASEHKRKQGRALTHTATAKRTPSVTFRPTFSF